MTNYDEAVCKRLRKQIYLTIAKGGMGHLASCFSCLEILYTLYMKQVMKYDSNDVNKIDRDRLILSKGHAGIALYWVMCEAGMLDAKLLDTFLQYNSHIGGEPCMRDLPGIEASTGSLGHGLSVAVGMAMAQKIDEVDARTFVVIGDGECEEGTIWEAAISAAAFCLNNLVVILDCNNIQKMATIIGTIGLANWGEKWKAFGWIVKEIDGHNVGEIQMALQEKNDSDKPLLLIAHTIKGKGVSIMENNPLWHFRLPNKKEKKVFQSELNISEEEMV